MDFYHLATCSSPETLVRPTTTAAHRLAVEHGGHRFEWRVDGVYLDGEKVPDATSLGANERGPIIEFGPWTAPDAAKEMLRRIGWNV